MALADLKDGEIDLMIMKKKSPSLDALENNLAQEVMRSESQSVQAPIEKTESTEPKRKKIQLPIYPPAEVHEQLRYLAFQERTSINALTMEALDLLFKARGLKSISGLINKNQ